MASVWLYLVFAALWLPALAHAKESCPWLDAATASGALDVVVEVTVSHPLGGSADDATCTFTQRKGATFRELRIDVQTPPEGKRTLSAYTAVCTSKPIELKAVANEALACSIASKNGQLAAQVVGRLRDRIFVVQIRANTAWMKQEALVEKASVLADQISGNLY